MTLMRYLRPGSPLWLVLHVGTVAAIFAMGYFAEFRPVGAVLFGDDRSGDGIEAAIGARHDFSAALTPNAGPERVLDAVSESSGDRVAVQTSGGTGRSERRS